MESMESAHVVLIYVAMLPLFAVLVFFFVSRRSGWSRLSLHYRFEETFTGRTIPFRGARMRKARYKGVLIFGVSEQGLYIAPLVPFILFHPPLLIPWSDLSAEPVRLFFFSGHQITVTPHPDIYLQISEGSWQFMKEYLQ